MGFVEKMGLPPKPYDKNKDWTPDSSNCEGCQGAFTWINRKHHCRRCGGLFCNNCTLDRVYLRGQGDTAARVCKPCKQIEEAIKFELRHGKSKTPRGSSNPSNKDDNTDALLRQLLEKPHDEEVNVESIVASVANDDHDFHSPSQEKTPISPTNLHEQAQEEKKRYSALKKQGKDAEALKAFKRAKELERQAETVEKELKHQRRVSAGSSSIFGSKGSPRKEDPGSPDANISRRKSDPSDTSKKRRAPSQDLGKEKASSTEKDDLLSELKALGWSDKEIREVDKKPAVKTEEQLLAELAAEVRPKPDRAAATSAAAPGSNDAISTQVMAHKRQALAFKREGKLVEAKDELRKAKILEKQAEEMALLGPASDEDEASDDDELRALIRGLEREEKSKGNTGKKGASSQPIPEDFSIFSKFVDDDDDDVEVDDNDLDDPEMAAALRAMGFEEEEEEEEAPPKPPSRVTKTSEMTGPKLKEQILARKRKAVALKREGKIVEARAELGEAKKLEAQLENVGKVSSPTIVAQATPPVVDSKVEEEEEENVEVTNQDMRDPDMMAALRAMGFEDDEPSPSHEIVTKPDPAEEASLKQQILGIKRQALALKKEGRIDEARETLRRAKVLEQQLEDLQAVVQRQEETPAIIKQSQEARRGAQALPVLSGLLNMDDGVGDDEEEDVEVENDDLVDPDIASALAALLWQEDPAESHPKDGAAAVVSEPTPADVRAADEPQPQEAEAKKVEVLQTKKSELTPVPATSNPVISSKTKAELQRELLGRKRRALAFKREGKSEEASIELEEAKVIEKQMAELEKGVAINKQMAELEMGVAVSAPPIELGLIAGSKPAAATAHPPPQQASMHLLKQDSEPSRPVYLDDKVETTKDNMQDSSRLGLLGSKEGTVPNKTIPVLDNSVERKAAGDSLAQTGKGGEKMEKILDFDWGVPHAKRADKETGKKRVSKEQGPLKEKEEDTFEGEYGEIGLTLDVIPSLLGGAKDRATPPQQQQQRSSWRFGLIDLLSGDRSSSNASQEQPPAIKESEAKILPPPPQVSSKSSERPPADTPTSKPTASLQQEILALKRKALGLKREGKAAEAREELRKAKLLEKQTGSEAIVVTSTVAAAAGTGSTTTHEKVEETSSVVYTTPSRPEAAVAVKTSPPSKSPGHKEEMQKQVRQTKDRMKLQQESLAHKRKAMGLRRQGKTEEADAEYELAKELEKQMEDLDPMHGKEELGDVAGVDDLLDPQLLAALKGVGFREGDLTGHNAPAPVTAKPRTSDAAASSTSRSSIAAPSNPALEAEKKQLQEQIRAQKLQAVQLKRAGKQGEALEKLRGAKQLEKRLLAFPT